MTCGWVERSESIVGPCVPHRLMMGFAQLNPSYEAVKDSAFPLAAALCLPL
jgi:hypothetical protein